MSYVLILIFAAFAGLSAGCGSRKAKPCPAYQEGQMTGGSIDKNKRKRKTDQGIFDPKLRRKYK